MTRTHQRRPPALQTAGRRSVVNAVVATKWLVVGAVTGLLSALTAVVLLVVAVLCLIGIGLPLVAPALSLARGTADLERRRLEALGHSSPSAHTPIPQDWRRAWRFALTDPGARRDYAWLAIHGTFGMVVGALPVELLSDTAEALSLPIQWYLRDGSFTAFNALVVIETGSQARLGFLSAIIFAAAWIGLSPYLLRWQSAPGVRLLAPHPDIDLSERVAQLTASRAAALDAHAVELRRIERALHDGAQNRLVTVAVLTGAARQSLAHDPAMVAPVLEQVQESAEVALEELRSVVRSILPPVLESEGLPGALSALAAECPIETTLDAVVEPRCPIAIEAIAYFTVAEALTNVTRHSRARRAAVHVRRDGERLHVEVSDDGTGGATVTSGSGLGGIHDRVRAHDGTLRLHSPKGGPTVLEVALPCG